MPIENTPTQMGSSRKSLRIALDRFLLPVGMGILTLMPIYMYSRLYRMQTVHLTVTESDNMQPTDIDSLNLYSGDSQSLQRRIWNDSCDISHDCLRTLKQYIYKGLQTNLEFDDYGYDLCRGENASMRVSRSPPTPNAVPVVPNIAHYIWFGRQRFRFDHLISLLSAHRIMKADRIMFHTDSEPTGKYWKEAKNTIPVLEVVRRQMPMTVFNYSLAKADVRHRSDISRLEILLEYGGVYMDMDIIVVKPLDSLRYYDCVFGLEHFTRLNNAIIFAMKGSLFIKLFLDGYQIYNRFCWNCDSIQFPFTLSKQCPHLVHVEAKGNLVRIAAEQEIFAGEFKWMGGHYTVHTFIREFFQLPKNADKAIDFDAENIRRLNTPFGEMCRYIYYGQKDIIET